MNKIDKYINRITQSLDCRIEEKEELRIEFLDHLNSLKDEYMIKGYSEMESIDKAISDFGDESLVSKELNKTISTLQKVLNKFFKLIWWMYILVISWLLIRPGRGYYTMDKRSYNLLPFKQIMVYIERYHHYNFDIWFLNLFGNIILFMPFGFLLPVCFKRGRNLWSNLVFTFLFSLAIETWQYVFIVGIFDVDDIMLNVVGGFVGFLIYKLVRRVLKKSQREYLL